MTFFFADPNTSSTDRDAGFCSGGDEDDLEVEDDIHSPTDASEDSVEVKVTPISLRNKNKRKCAEPRKVSDDLPSGPLKKRIRFELNKSTTDSEGSSPFRPWSIPQRPQIVHPQEIEPRQTTVINYHPVYGYQTPPIQQEEPLSLVKNRPESPRQRRRDLVPEAICRPKEVIKIEPNISQIPRVPPHPAVRPPLKGELIEEYAKIPKTSPGFSVESLLSSNSQQKDKPSHDKPQKEQRNYKNMTRERRIEANARERTRVHTISAAFDTLRRSIPSYSHNQKLSKLSVLRIACSYILTLSRVAGNDYSEDQTAPSLANCVDLVSKTIQTEGKLRKKKDDS